MVIFRPGIEGRHLRAYVELQRMCEVNDEEKDHLTYSLHTSVVYEAIYFWVVGYDLSDV